jgi:hypothetical protein
MFPFGRGYKSTTKENIKQEEEEEEEEEWR